MASNGVSCWLLHWHGQQPQRQHCPREHFDDVQLHDLCGLDWRDVFRGHEQTAMKCHSRDSDAASSQSLMLIPWLLSC
jgi:hypothetical protein